MQVVVIGGGQAGAQLAISLRENGYQGEVTLVSEELTLPYYRPPLSKTYLKDGDKEKLLLRQASFYEKTGIRIKTGIRAERIDRAGSFVELANGERLPYSHLVLALGARNRSLALTDLMHSPLQLRTVADADHIRECAHDASRIVVVGAGFVGLEIAASLRATGKNVTVLEAGERVLGRIASSSASKYIYDKHKADGVDIRVNVLAKQALYSQSRFSGVRLHNGDEIEGDEILVAVGVQPNIELAASAGLEVSNGICVNDKLITQDPTIFAIGDCAAFIPPWGGERIRLESVQNAVDQAKCVTATITGTPTSYNSVPWFWSDQGDYRLQLVGLPNLSDGVVVRHDDKNDRLAVFGFRYDELVSVETVNFPTLHAQARRAFSSRKRIRRSEIASVDFDFAKVA